MGRQSVDICVIRKCPHIGIPPEKKSQRSCRRVCFLTGKIPSNMTECPLGAHGGYIPGVSVRE